MLAISVDLGIGVPGAGDLTDEDGTYAITGLRNGSHLLEFVDLSGTHTSEFYDDVPTPAGSSIVHVTGAGTTTADADLASQAAAPPPGRSPPGSTPPWPRHAESGRHPLTGPPIA